MLFMFTVLKLNESFKKYQKLNYKKNKSNDNKIILRTFKNIPQNFPYNKNFQLPLK